MVDIPRHVVGVDSVQAIQQPASVMFSVMIEETVVLILEKYVKEVVVTHPSSILFV